MPILRKDPPGPLANADAVTDSGYSVAFPYPTEVSAELKDKTLPVLGLCGPLLVCGPLLFPRFLNFSGGLPCHLRRQRQQFDPTPKKAFYLPGHEVRLLAQVVNKLLGLLMHDIGSGHRIFRYAIRCGTHRLRTD